MNRRFLRDVNSSQRQVVVRVLPFSDYRIFVTDSPDESDRISFASAARTPTSG